MPRDRPVRLVFRYLAAAIGHNGPVIIVDAIRVREQFFLDEDLHTRTTRDKSCISYSREGTRCQTDYEQLIIMSVAQLGKFNFHRTGLDRSFSTFVSIDWKK